MNYMKQLQPRQRCVIGTERSNFGKELQQSTTVFDSLEATALTDRYFPSNLKSLINMILWNNARIKGGRWSPELLLSLSGLKVSTRKVL